LQGQSVDLARQGKNLDFRTSTNVTAPIRMGTLLPSACGLGEFVFLTGIPAGGSLYVCSNTDTWTEVRGAFPAGGGSGFVLASSTNGNFWAPIVGDVTGFPGTIQVSGLRTRPLSAAAPQNGQALLWNGTEWAPATLNTAPGTLTVEANGVIAGTRGVHNYLPGFGLLTAITDTGSRLTLQHFVDASVMLTRAAYQEGQEVRCLSSSASSTAYTCALAPPISQYVTGMRLEWRPDVNGAGGATTLNVNGLGPRPVKLRDGAADPRATDLKAGQVYPIWFDGAGFRILGNIEGLLPAASSRPDCAAASRGQMWLTAAGLGARDELAVCAKDENDAFVWRVIP
jgi:hypothetical protein